MKAKHHLEHLCFSFLSERGLQDKKILIAVSGGLDSVALMRVLAQIHSREKLGVFHFHHGPSEKPEVLKYRDQAQEVVRKLAESLDLPFYGRQASELLSSEDDYRKARLEAWEQVRVIHGYDVIALGHHADDLLETRLLRLIRGTGIQGLVAMEESSPRVLRPFLRLSTDKLKDYLRDLSQNYLEDPSNADSQYLRNWLRNEWLPILEQRQPGAKMRLSSSLELIAESGRDFPFSFSEKGLSRPYWLSWTTEEKKRQLAGYLLKSLGVSFSSGNIDEILKRLDRSQVEFSFEYIGHFWSVDAEFIKAIPREK